MVASANPGAVETAAYRTFSDPQKRVPNTLFFYNFLGELVLAGREALHPDFTGTGNADALNLVDGSFTPRVLVVAARWRRTVATAVDGGGGNGGGKAAERQRR